VAYALKVMVLKKIKHALPTLNLSKVLKKIKHALPTLNLSKAQCDKLVRPILQAALPKAGYNRNFPKEVIHTARMDF
jgi:hypothetical protein